MYSQGYMYPRLGIPGPNRAILQELTDWASQLTVKNQPLAIKGRSRKWSDRNNVKKNFKTLLNSSQNRGFETSANQNLKNHENFQEINNNLIYSYMCNSYKLWIPDSQLPLKCAAKDKIFAEHITYSGVLLSQNLINVCC